MEAKTFKSLMHIKYKWTWWLSRLEFWVGHTILITHQDQWDPHGLTFCGSGGIYGDLFYLYCKSWICHFIKYYLNLARSTKKFTEMFQKLRPKLQLLVGREINVCSNCLDFNSSFLLFFQYLGRMFQLLGVGCSNYWELKWAKLSCLLIQQLLVESKKLDL
jgi:hypothetical protein